MEKYEVLSSSVIKKDNLFFTRVSSAQCIESRLIQQDAGYEIDVENIEIQMKDNTSTSGIKFTYYCEKNKINIIDTQYGETIFYKIEINDEEYINMIQNNNSDNCSLSFNIKSNNIICRKFVKKAI